MSVARTWLWIGLATATWACSRSGDGAKARGEATQATAAVSPTPVPVAATAPADGRFDAGSLGALTFALTEGTPEARLHFMRGLLAVHSFWYDEATREFQAAVTADPTMNMAYWGIAMSKCKLLWGEDDLDAARAALRQMPSPERLSPREQAWVLATIELVGEGDVRTSRTRFADAMAQLNAQYPDDESATFLAVALLATTHPGDPDTVEVRKRAAALAIGVFEHNPKHPGAAHYLIHAYDTPELAPLALPYAQAYAKIAPAAFHARHMPAHIFSRLGMWQDAITSCQSAWDASVSAADHAHLSANHHDFHSLSWLVDMDFELGRRNEADRALHQFGDAVRAGLGRQNRTLYATEVASYMMRSGEWSRADELLAPLAEAPVEDGDPDALRVGAPATHCAPAASSPYALSEQQAVVGARARAAAMLHDVAKTRRYVAELDAANASLRQFLETSQPKPTIARLAVAHARRSKALLARATGDDRALLGLLREAATDADDETGGESNPSGFVAHEEIADVLMRLAQPKQAAAEYAHVLQTHPRRAHALLGAARAANRFGDHAAARARYQQLVEQWHAADDGIEGLAEARAAVGN